MDFECHFNSSGLDFKLFLEAILACKFNPTCVCDFCFALHFVELQAH